MNTPHFLKNLAAQLAGNLPAQMQALKDDMEKNFHIILQNAFRRLDLVTREEFDTQTKVLARSRQKITEIEQALQALEKTIKDNEHPLANG